MTEWPPHLREKRMRNSHDDAHVVPGWKKWKLSDISKTGSVEIKMNLHVIIIIIFFFLFTELKNKVRAGVIISC